MRRELRSPVLEDNEESMKKLKGDQEREQTRKQKDLGLVRLILEWHQPKPFYYFTSSCVIKI